LNLFAFSKANITADDMVWRTGAVVSGRFSHQIKSCYRETKGSSAGECFNAMWWVITQAVHGHMKSRQVHVDCMGNRYMPKNSEISAMCHSIFYKVLRIQIEVRPEPDRNHIELDAKACFLVGLLAKKRQILWGGNFTVFHGISR
jgi:hypothetical protein